MDMKAYILLWRCEDGWGFVLILSTNAMIVGVQEVLEQCRKKTIDWHTRKNDRTQLLVAFEVQVGFEGMQSVNKFSL